MAQTLAYTLMGGLVIGLGLGLMYGLVFGLVNGLVNGLVFGLAFGLAFGNGAMWVRYLIGTVLAARRGAAPHRLAFFLDWGLDVGLFRMSGYTLQFRHRDLYHALLTHAADGISLEAPGRPVDRAKLREDTEPGHVSGVDVGQLLDVGGHDDHDPVQVGLRREVGKDVPSEPGRESVATAAGEVVTEDPRPGTVGVNELGGVGGEVADDPAVSTSTGVDEQLDNSDEHDDADRVNHQHHASNDDGDAKTQGPDDPCAEDRGGNGRSHEAPAGDPVEPGADRPPE